jgi:8-oxo-dGTP pyrophosphatase MutT (NUDIX family)
MPARWPALAEASRAAAARVPFVLGGRVVGSVARAHLDALRPFADALVVLADGVQTLPALDAARLHAINQQLRAQGLVRAWRDETYPIPDPATPSRRLGTLERAASRFWGTLTFGAHANGYVVDAAGRPQALWIARRSPHKATDPGLLDNLVGGGVPAHQSPRETLVREGFEEAGLAPHELAAAQPGSVLRLHRDIPEGFQHEWLYSFDLALPAGRVPANQDGEVAGFTLMPLAEVAELVASTEELTVDAALVTIDFLARHRVLDDAEALARLHSLRVG